MDHAQNSHVALDRTSLTMEPFRNFYHSCSKKKPMSANLQKSIGSQGIPIFAIRSAAPVPLESMQTPHAHQQTVASKTSNAPLPSAITPSPGIGSHADVNNPSTNANSVSAFLHKNLDNHDIPPASSSPTRMKTFLPNNIRVPASASVQQQGLSKKVSQIPISSSTTTEESVFLTEEDSFKESAKHVPSLTHCGPIASTTPSTTSQILQIPSTVTPTMCLDQNNDKDDFTRAHDDCMRNIRDFNDLKGNYEEKLLEATVSLDQAMAAMLKVQADKIDLSDAMNAMKSTLDAMLRDICDN